MSLPPRWKLDVLQPPATEPVGVADVKQYARIGFPKDDDLFATLITSARVECEHRLRRCLLTTQLQITFEWPPPCHPNRLHEPFVGPRQARNGAIDLPRPPLISVDSMTFSSWDGSETPIDLTTLGVSLGTPGQIYPRNGGSWPLNQFTPGCYKIAYTAGCPDSSQVPVNVKLAIMWLVNYWYVHRSEVGAAPTNVDRLLAPAMYASIS